MGTLLTRLFATTLALTAAFLLTAPIAHAQPVTATGNVTPFPSPNPLPNDWLVDGPLIIGDTGTGSLLLENYVGVYSTVGRIGNEAGSDGTVTVNSSSYWESSSDLFIGRAGTGKMVVGGAATVGTVDTSIADQAGSTGTVEITGWGATWDNSGDFYVGRGGSASLTIGTVASLTTQSLYTAMDSLHGSGNIYAKGVVLDFSVPGEKLIFDSTHSTDQTLTYGGGGSLNLDIDGTGALGVGFRGAGEMQIKDALKVSSSEGYLGMIAGSAGTGTVTGVGSEWNIAAGLYAGQEGRATLFIGNGGKVSSAWGSIDSGAGSPSSVNVLGAGSAWNNANQLVVGDKGLARLQAMNGGQVVSATGIIGSLTDSYGQVFIQGTNSTWTMNGDLKVGNGGQGDLHVENGGVVSNAVGYVGAASGGVGNVIVTGTGSQWNSAGSLYLGKDGTGNLTVSDGGTVTAQTLYTAMSSLQGSGLIQTHGVVLDFASPSDKLVFDSSHGTSQAINFGSTGSMELTIDGTGALGVGFRGTGEMQIQDARKVSSSEGHLGMLAGSSGTGTVTGAGSEWNVSTDLHIGQGGSGSLIVAAGGSVTAGSLTVYSAGDSLTLDGGSVTTTGGVFINSGATLDGDGTINGNLSVANGALFAFDPTHTLTVNGTVTMDSSFGIANLLGLDDTVAIGAYTLIDGTGTDFSLLGLQNWGEQNAYNLGNGKSAYFSQGSLVVNVVPEPSTSALLLLGIGGVMFARMRRVRG